MLTDIRQHYYYYFNKTFSYCCFWRFTLWLHLFQMQNFCSDGDLQGHRGPTGEPLCPSPWTDRARQTVGLPGNVLQQHSDPGGVGQRGLLSLRQLPGRTPHFTHRLQSHGQIWRYTIPGNAKERSYYFLITTSICKTKKNTIS